jgi:hypothetical protein
MRPGRMATMNDDGLAIALRARAAAFEAEAEAARASAHRLACELSVARAESRIARARLMAIASKARAHIPHVRDERGRLVLGDIAVIAEGGERAIMYLHPIQAARA